MSMRKTDFETIAQAIKDSKDALRIEGHPLPRQTVQIFNSLSRSIADVCAKQNSRFDRARFLSACGVDGY